MADRVGPGEQGAGVVVTAGERLVGEAERGTAGFQVTVSEWVSLQRAVPDHRHTVCQSVQYPSQLPAASVIIIFADEARSVLLRTAHSVVNRSPPALLKEVLLVDDASTLSELGTDLDLYINGAWPDGIVKVIRLKHRSGLIRARLAGARAATGDVIVVLDGHIEVNKGWLEPLLSRIQQNRKLLVTPALDSVNPDTFEYERLAELVRIVFRWDMEYEYVPLAGEVDPRSPITSTAMVGCAFAMDRHTFFEMGAFDEGMEVWGAENVEIAIRLWMCGGGVEVVPCSRVAHLFRYKFPYKTASGDFVGRNTQRVADVWLDEYSRYYYNLRPYRQGKECGDISSRVELKKKLSCHSFEWFIENISLDTFMYDRDVIDWGQLENPATRRCVDLLSAKGNHQPLGLWGCHKDPTTTSQLISLSLTGQLRRRFLCAHYDAHDTGSNVTMSVSCNHNFAESWRWAYRQGTHELVYLPRQLCLDATGNLSHGSQRYATLSKCSGSDTQQWVFNNKKRE